MTRPDVDHLCRVMHDAYEKAAAEAGWETQAASRVDWDNVPGANKQAMRAAVYALLGALTGAEEAAEAALILAERWNKGWTGAVRYAEWTKEFEVITDCADELLQALSPFVLPRIEAVGLVPWPDHPDDRQAVEERIDQKSTTEGSPLPLGGGAA